MPYIKYPTWKFGINPDIRSFFDLSNLTGTQKLTLTSGRIFGNTINGNQRAGNKVLRRNLLGAKRLSIFDIPVWDISQKFPFLKNCEKHLYEQDLNDKRKLRVMMRGIKVGRTKGGGRISLINVFEKKPETAPQESNSEKNK